MKKVFLLSLVCLLILSNSVYASSYTNTKYKYNRYSKNIKQNNRKISTIKSSKNLSSAEKKRQIRKLEHQNYYIKRKQDYMKREYSKIFS